MDIRCERCGTEYEFDDNRVTEAGITVKCSSCGHMFKIRKKSFVLTEPVVPGQEEAPASKNWMIRKPDGQMLSFKELTTLQKWIVERKVSREDEISRSGESWKKLGSIAELASFFRVVDQSQPVLPAMPPPAAPVTQPLPAVVPPQSVPPPATPYAPPVGQPPAPYPQAAAYPTGPLPAAPMPASPPMPSYPGLPAAPPASAYPQPGMPPAGGPVYSGAPLSQPALPVAPPPSYPSMPSVPSMPSMPSAPAYPAAPLPPVEGRAEPDSWDERAAGDAEDDVVEKWRRRGRRKWMVIVPLLIVVLGAGAFYLLMPEKVHELWRQLRGGEEIPALALQQFKSGVEAFMRDTPARYEEALTNFQSAISESKGRFAKAQAALALVHLARMERARERVRAIDARLKALEDQAAQLAPKDGKEASAEAKAKLLELAAEKEKLAAEREAQAAAGRQDQDAAERAIGTARELEPESFEGRVAQAELLRVRGSDRAQIDVLIAELEKVRPQDPELLFVSGAAAATDPAARDTAVRLLNAAIESAQREGRPEFLRARHHLARVLIEQKRTDEAKVQLERILQQSPDHPEAKELLASLAPPPPPPPPEEKKPEEKKPEEKPAAPAAPSDYDGWMTQANRLQERGRSQEALAAYQAALGFKADDVEAQSGVGLCYLDLGNYSAAIAAFRKALQRNANYADAVMGLAEAHRYLGNKDEARKFYQKYLDILPNGPEAAVARRNLEELK